MKEAVLIYLMDCMDDKNKVNMMLDPVKVIKEQFILNNVLRRYLEHLIRYAREEITIDEINNTFEINNQVWDPPKKITNDFDIGRHELNYHMYLHSHTYIELDYVYKGSCKYYINDSNNFFILNENEVCIVNQHIVHGIEAAGSDNIIIKCMIPFEYIDIERLKDIETNNEFKQFLLHALSDNYNKAGYIVANIKDREKAENIFYNIFKEYLTKDNGWRQVVKNYLSVLLIELMRIKVSDFILIKEMDEEKLNIAKALECIQKNYKYIKLEDMAKDLHFHKNYLSRLIRQNFKQNFREILNQARLREAENMLLKTDMRVCEIAAKIGYNKPNYFYKMFKDYYGVTPIEYRKKGEERK